MEWHRRARACLSFLVGGDYVMTFNEDKTVTELELTVELAQPANLYILIDNRVPPPEWLTRDFIDTNADVGLDEVHSHVNVETAAGAGNESRSVLFGLEARGARALEQSCSARSVMRNTRGRHVWCRGVCTALWRRHS